MCARISNSVTSNTLYVIRPAEEIIRLMISKRDIFRLLPRFLVPSVYVLYIDALFPRHHCRRFFMDGFDFMRFSVDSYRRYRRTYNEDVSIYIIIQIGCDSKTVKNILHSFIILYYNIISYN